MASFLIKLFAAVVMFFPVVFADEVLKLSGIMAGDKPTAIINDQIVAVGDWVGDIEIKAIAADHVICQGKQGRFELRLNVSDSPVITSNKAAAIASQAKNVSQQNKVQPSGNSAPAPVPVKVRRYLEQSLEYLKQADELLKSPLVSERLYTKAAHLCDLADKEAQQTFRFASSDEVRKNVKAHIDKVRRVKGTILAKKSDFATHIRSLIAARQIKTGMTSRDVTSSWGPPLMQNRDGQLEKWAYQDANGRQKELIFRDGILIGY